MILCKLNLVRYNVWSILRLFSKDRRRQNYFYGNEICLRLSVRWPFMRWEISFWTWSLPDGRLTAKNWETGLTCKVTSKYCLAIHEWCYMQTLLWCSMAIYEEKKTFTRVSWGFTWNAFVWKLLQLIKFKTNCIRGENKQTMVYD